MGARCSRRPPTVIETSSITFPLPPLPPLAHPNALHTNKYSFSNPLVKNFFLWKGLAEQFKRLGNIYFLVIGCIM